MALPSSLLSEEQFLCSICLDVFVSPVTTPCGHNFCMRCIGGFWDRSDVYQCPLCKRAFPARPDLSVNRFVRELTEQFQKVRVDSPAERGGQPAGVPCDVCTGERLEAVKSCLVCLASYCGAHLEPHLRVVTLRGHKLVSPTPHLEDRMCPRHGRPLELFCRRDRTCICVLCTEMDHRAHSTVPAEREWSTRKGDLEQLEVRVHLMIQERLRKVKEIKQAAELSRRAAQREREDGARVFAALLSALERGQAELLEEIEGRARAAERRAGELVTALEQEVAELRRRSAELEQLSRTEDHIHFLQTFSALQVPQETTKWSDVAVHADHYLGTVREAASQVVDVLQHEVEGLSADELKRIQQYEADVFLDPDTAYPSLVVSRDRRSVRLGCQRQALPDNPDRFDLCICVLGRGGLTSGRHYWEVEVGEKSDWAVGVAKASINRKGTIRANPKNGYWCLCLRNDLEYKALTARPTSLPLSLKPRKVGIFVDYEEGRVSFYKAETGLHIYTFHDAFLEKLLPFFSPCASQGGRNPDSLSICPVGDRKSK